MTNIIDPRNVSKIKFHMSMNSLFEFSRCVATPDSYDNVMLICKDYGTVNGIKCDLIKAWNNGCEWDSRATLYIGQWNDGIV